MVKDIVVSPRLRGVRTVKVSARVSVSFRVKVRDRVQVGVTLGWSYG